LWMNLQKNYDLWHAEQATNTWQTVKPLSLQVRGIQ